MSPVNGPQRHLPQHAQAAASLKRDLGGVPAESSGSPDTSSPPEAGNGQCYFDRISAPDCMPSETPDARRPKVQAGPVPTAAPGRRGPPGAIADQPARPQAEQNIIGNLGVLNDACAPIAHGSKTHPRAPGLDSIGMLPTLKGLLFQINRDARTISRRIAHQPLRQPVTRV